MKKYLVTIEFRYSDAPSRLAKYDDTSRNKKVTIGVFEDYETACNKGNELLQVLESKFKLHRFPAGNEATKKRFSLNGGPFGHKNDLVSNMAYLRTPFAFYAKITTLNHEPIKETIQDILNSVERYREYKKKEQEY